MNENKTYLKYRDVCRCCLDNPGSKNMWAEYLSDNDREVYGEMLCDCFGVSWDADNEELICDSCIYRLREAVKLKIEFLAAQEVLRENIMLNVKKGQLLIKSEAQNDEEYEVLETSDMFAMEQGDTVNDMGDNISVDSNNPAMFRIFQSITNKTKRKKEYKLYTKEAMDKAIEAVKVHGKSMSEAATKFCVPRKTLALRLAQPLDEYEARHVGSEKKLKLVNEIQILLQNTNAVPFKTKITRRFCAYCFTDGPAFDDNIELRSHMKFYHKTNYIKGVEFMMRPWHINEVLKLDITDLQCTSCNISIEDWNSMFVHFAQTHELEFDEAYNKIIPFSLTIDNKCTLCYDTFTTFGNLDVHMNAHYCNYICYECGDPFLSSTRLDAHLRIHKTGKFVCKICDKVFAMQQHVIRHIELDHSDSAVDVKWYSNSKTTDKSENCTEMPCEYCGTCFESSASLDNHIKKMHMKKKRKRAKKNYVCGVCGTEFEKFVSLKYHWREHMELIPFQKI
ncbi:zinc finger protein 26-like [Aricia agestis]|uniref:zinc finger protein 26-like n=1 Tax=Aricia agestis TaxID=91739 RepID=UPI001C207474|nr:zinc finger protein 26-like [Aricia agestis]